MILLKKKLRLNEYDYSQNGYYFVTICTKSKGNILGFIENEKLILNENGLIAFNVWKDIPEHYEDVSLDEFIIMPDHIHGIIIIDNDNNNVMVGQCPTTTVNNNYYGKLSKIINAYKNIVTKSILKNNRDLIFKWQRSFYDHIIRDDESLDNIRNYIKYNYLKEYDNKNYL